MFGVGVGVRRRRRCAAARAAACCARRPTWPAKVALYITVWRAAGRGSAISVMSSMKPMSSMRSASSSTSISTLSSTRLAALQVVDQAAGRGDQDVERAAQRLASAPGRARRRPRWRRAGPAHGGRRCAAALATCIASSRVGVSTSMRGPCTHALVASLAWRRPRAAQHALQRGQDEGRGLAAAGAGRDHQVGAGDAPAGSPAAGRRWAVGVAGIGDGAGRGLRAGRGSRNS